MRTNEKIKELREEKHWSQEELAEKMHIAPSSYAKIERGETRLTLDRLERFAEVFDVEISSLIQPSSSTSYQFNENTNNNGYIYNNSGTTAPTEKEYQAEIEKLQLKLQHKNEIIAQKDNELIALKKLLAMYEKEV